MADREKVIGDLEEQIAWIRDNDFHKFPGWGHAVLAMRDALALLKEQEARVMTLGDLRSIGSVWELNTPPYLWMEINPSYRWTRGFWVAWREIYDMIDGLHPTYDADNYQKIWRCWTSRPTDEHRQAVKWE